MINRSGNVGRAVEGAAAVAREIGRGHVGLHHPSPGISPRREKRLRLRTGGVVRLEMDRARVDDLEVIAGRGEFRGDGMLRKAGLVDQRIRHGCGLAGGAHGAVEDDVVVEVHLVLLEQVVETERRERVEQNEELAVVRDVLVERLLLVRAERHGWSGDHHRVGVRGNRTGGGEVEIVGRDVFALEHLPDQAVAGGRLRVVERVLAVAGGKIDLGRLALDQADDRAGELLLALVAADLAGLRILVEQVGLLHHPAAVLVLEDDEVVVPGEVQPVLQLDGPGAVVDGVDLVVGDVLAADALIFLEQVFGLVPVLRVLLVDQQGGDVYRGIEVLEDVPGLARKRVELRRGEIGVRVVLEADIIRPEEEKNHQRKVERALQARGTTAGPRGSRFVFHGAKISPSGGGPRPRSWPGRA